MVKRSRRVWVVVLCLVTTFVFWGLLQSHVEMVGYDVPLESGRDHAKSLYRRARSTSRRMAFRSLKPAHTNGSQWTGIFKIAPGGTSPNLKPPKSTRLLPQLGEREDRILQQINLIPVDPAYDDASNEKLILLFNGYPYDVPQGNKKFHIDGCPVRNCFLTDDRDDMKQAHAIVYEGGLFSSSYRHRPPGQISIIYLLESPENIADLTGHINRYNWTATYRLDSTMNTPYERFISYANTTAKLPPPTRNHAQGKTKKVAWFVSNCYTTNKRGAYARELQKFIDVDVYGACGNMTCFRSDKDRCYKMLSSDYKFYLAFENSNCRDYITEKFYWNALYNNVVPVVMGARPQDYKAVAPPGSYIHVDDFESPRHLANYLHRLDNNDDLYNDYFRWKGTGEFINTKYWCRLCSMVHEAYSANSATMWYGDIHRWWNGPGVCIGPGPSERWASWRSYDNMAGDRVVAGPNTVYYGSKL